MIKSLVVASIAFALSGCVPDEHNPFEDGTIVHHKVDNKPGLVLSCEESFCRVRVDSAKEYVIWGLPEIKEKAKPRQ